MNFRHLIFLVSESCNFNCSYCYQSKSDKWMNPPLSKEIMDFFYPQITDHLQVHFVGGEPLLNFKTIKETVNHVKIKNRILKKKIRYSITTNGSLVTHEILDFFNTYHFKLELSFDGVAQECCRKRGSFRPTIDLIQEILKYPQIELTVNSVFTPATVGLLSQSLKTIADLNVSRLELSLALNQEWPGAALSTLRNELEKTRKNMLSSVRKTGTIPLGFYHRRNEEGIWRCAAGQDQLCVSASGEIWGCPLFYEYFKTRKPKHKDFPKYFFGHFPKNKKDFFIRAKAISENHQILSMDNFHTSAKHCFLCENLDKCALCPILTSLPGKPLEYIPDHVCELSQIMVNEKDSFSLELDSIQSCRAKRVYPVKF